VVVDVLKNHSKNSELLPQVFIDLDAIFISKISRLFLKTKPAITIAIKNRPKIIKFDTEYRINP
jgi:hypothetical protein